MIGETTERSFGLDYTAVAVPLSAVDVQKDITELRTMDRYPREITLWRHQWDWIVASAQGFASPGARIAADAVGILVGSSILQHQNKTAKFLWGIPVTVPN